MIFVGSANVAVGHISGTLGYRSTLTFLMMCSMLALSLLFIIKVYEKYFNRNRLDWYTPSRQAERDEIEGTLSDEDEDVIAEQALLDPNSQQIVNNYHYSVNLRH